MKFKSTLYAILSISFILLFFSLYLSLKSIDSTSDMINHIETKQIKLTKLASKLNNDIEINQSNILQSIILKSGNYQNNIHESFDKLKHVVKNLDDFIKTSNIHIDEIDKILITIKTRMIGYKAVEVSLIEALNLKDDIDIQDALIGFNAITIKFEQDINRLVKLSEETLSKNINLLKQTNSDTDKTIKFSFVISFILILFSMYKLILLHNTIELELNRAESAEKEQKKLQSQLLKYNDDLENEVAKKSKELHQKMYTHFLSGLPNRNKLLEDSNIYNFQQMALLNIDKFQKFNDVYGEEIGNIALQLTAEFLEKQINDDDTLLYHIGGDEFVIVVKNSNLLNNSLFIELIEKILHNYSRENFLYDNKKFNFNMSVGVSFSADKKMLAYADMALKDAKKRNIQLSVFNDDKGLEKIHQEDIECHEQLLEAFNNKGIISFYQPIIPIQDTSKATKYESLARIVQKNGNIIPPLKFIPIAKANRIYHKLTKHVVNNTLDTITKYKVPCSLNISMDDIENKKTLNMLYEIFDLFSDNNLLTIELLETEEFKDYTEVYDFCIKIRSYGIKIALDDFGSGYSNFSHILNLPIDFIKIDASLISSIDRDTNSRIMVETIVELAKKLKIETVAEFVSSQEILNIVKKLGVDYAQGFHLGKPERIETHLDGNV